MSRVLRRWRDQALGVFVIDLEMPQSLLRDLRLEARLQHLGLLVVLDGLVQAHLVLVPFLARPVEGLLGAGQVEVRFREVGLELHRLLVLLDGLAVVLFLVEPVAVLEGGLRLDEAAAEAGQDQGKKGGEHRCAISGSHRPSPVKVIEYKRTPRKRIIGTRLHPSQGTTRLI